MPNKIYWQAYSKLDRTKVIEDIKNTISDHEGWIVNFTMFSDLAISFTIETEEQHIHKIYSALRTIINMAKFENDPINRSSENECQIFLNVSFAKGTGLIKYEIPNVPG